VTPPPAELPKKTKAEREGERILFALCSLSLSPSLSLSLSFWNSELCASDRRHFFFFFLLRSQRRRTRDPGEAPSQIATIPYRYI